MKATIIPSKQQGMNIKNSWTNLLNQKEYFNCMGWHWVLLSCDSSFPNHQTLWCYWTGYWSSNKSGWICMEGAIVEWMEKKQLIFLVNNVRGH
jgi:hypothetical protein